MSEQQVLPEFIATLKAAAERATPRHGFLDAKDGAEFNRLTPPAVILKLLASLAQSEAERERLQESYEQSTYSLGMKVIETATLRAELAREREANQWIEIKEGCEMPKDFEDVHVICANGDRAIAWTESDDPNWYETYGGEEPLLKAILWHPFPAASLEPKSKPVATTS